MIMLDKNYLTILKNEKKFHIKKGIATLFLKEMNAIHYPAGNYRIRFPKGMSDSSINLKCCRPKGIPIIVRHSRIPKKR